MTVSTEERTETFNYRSTKTRRLWEAVSFRNIGAVYVLAAIIVIFSIWVPETFPTMDTVRQVVNGNSITALIALALVVPLCAQVFDLSVAYVATLSGVTAAYMIAHGLGVVFAISIGLGAALFVGLINGTVVVLFGVDSFIGTLATGSLVQAIIALITGEIQINDPRLSESFAKVSQTQIAGFTLPVVYALVIAALLWILMDHTATGRRLYATGFNREAARLVGVGTNRLRFVSLLLSSLIAGIAGIALMSSLGSGDPTAGSSYLLPAFAAVFLGATQLRGGRFNSWGTLIAVLLLGTGLVGLGLAQQPSWTANTFTGVVLIASLAITVQERSVLRGSTLFDRWRRSKSDQVEPAAPPVGEGS